jgi:cytochrome oxidase assembly protein ShyY1
LAFTSARLADGKIMMVNRGFVPERLQDAVPVVNLVT